MGKQTAIKVDGVAEGDTVRVVDADAAKPSAATAGKAAHGTR